MDISKLAISLSRAENQGTSSHEKRQTSWNRQNSNISATTLIFNKPIGRSPAQTVSSNPTRDMNVCLSCWVLCVDRYRSVRWADHSSRGVLLTVVRRSCVIYKPRVWGDPGTTAGGGGRRGCCASKKNCINICLPVELLKPSGLCWHPEVTSTRFEPWTRCVTQLSE